MRISLEVHIIDQMTKKLDFLVFWGEKLGLWMQVTLSMVAHFGSSSESTCRELLNKL